MQPDRQVIPVIVERHAEDAAFLWLLRDAAVRAPHYNLRDLAELDQRLEAHLDGLRIADAAGWAVCESALAIGEPGEIFTAAVLAFEAGDARCIERVLEASEAMAQNGRALVSALVWSRKAVMFERVRELLAAPAMRAKTLGIAACAATRFDPGPVLATALAARDDAIRQRALRAAGELKRKDLLPQVLSQLEAEDEACRFWAAWSAVLLGHRPALAQLKAFVNFDTRFALPALQLAARALRGQDLHRWLRALAQSGRLLRLALIGAGISGDPAYVPTLIKHMYVPALARVAGEAFALITGADLAYLDLDTAWPEGYTAGPSDDPRDDDVALDRDEGLPWPEADRVAQWWASEREHYESDRRYLCGRPIVIEHCQSLLLSAYQRQRRAAALELQLLGQPGPLFATAAPGFQQLRLLAADAG